MLRSAYPTAKNLQNVKKKIKEFTKLNENTKITCKNKREVNDAKKFERKGNIGWEGGVFKTLKSLFICKLFMHTNRIDEAR